MTATVRKLKTGRAGDTSSTVAVISLLTDFGVTDYFVGAVKGVILSINPSARLIDITHEIPPQDIEAAAFTLLASYQSFPPNTIHLAIVDPGVGSDRRPVIVSTDTATFVGPDNGIFSYVLEQVRDYEVFHIKEEQYFRTPMSSTFHGRDVFAPVTAALSRGLRADAFGPKITDPVVLPSLRPLPKKRGLEGRIIHVDTFGNCITNFTKADIPDNCQLLVKGKRIKAFKQYFLEQIGSRHELFAIWGSAGFLEIAATNKSAAKLLHAKRGDTLKLVKC
ncbi:MAG TPA: SAM-dependent chlorinase/fluorinase [Pyrinomonadaceae bacterium]|nr:SAM-dependent chlorinase/fluorinase [Pyrinomonadaceae bacterium]